MGPKIQRVKPQSSIGFLWKAQTKNAKISILQEISFYVNKNDYENIFKISKF